KLKAGKMQFMISMLFGIISGLSFALVYATLTEVAFAIILTVLVFFHISLMILMRLRLIRFSQVHKVYLGSNMFGNFLGTLALGGIANSTGVFLFGLGSPFGMITRPTREFVRWFMASIGLVLMEAILQPWLRASNSIPPGAGAILWGLNSLIVCGIWFGNIFGLLRQRDTALQELHEEQVRSENLLLNVLPKKIADRLKREPGTIAEAHKAVTILFADIVGFTPLTSQLNPVEMIELLNKIYSEFDALSEKYQVEKIRTIGDNYMVASGVPESNEDHARNMARMALEMQAFADKLSIQNEHRIQFRIGIHSGPVIAGIVGRKKFQYDIWGDAVNTASRMESHGEAGKIQVSQTTYEMLKDEFVMKLRGTIDIKGKGPMKTWFLTGGKEGSNHEQ
ncbi:MAG TPA: adenylate/guanylate cyclase domain-containing protein, partial [Anaerolineales bacterium]|nr:adenylate/guanylate cyclase domain-containing protein [Anaerolineales bacterium]